jgi:hypothetical protein
MLSNSPLAAIPAQKTRSRGALATFCPTDSSRAVNPFVTPKPLLAFSFLVVEMVGAERHPAKNSNPSSNEWAPHLLEPAKLFLAKERPTDFSWPGCT